MLDSINSIVGVNRKNNDIGIGWDITTLCNYKCDYCYAMKNYGDDWNRDVNVDDSIKYIGILGEQNQDKNIHIQILGGEPTLSKNLGKIQETLKAKNIYLHLFTNLTKPYNWWKKSKNVLNLYSIEISMHINEIKDINRFLGRAESIKKHYGERLIVNLKIMVDPKCINHIQFQAKYYEKLKVLMNILDNISLDYIVKPGHENNQRQIYSECLIKFKKLYDLFSRKIIVNGEICHEDKIPEINMRGSLCQQNQYTYNMFGVFEDICSDKTYNNVEFFKKIKNSNGITCNHDFCPCFDFFENKKIIIGDN